MTYTGKARAGRGGRMGDPGLRAMRWASQAERQVLAGVMADAAPTALDGADGRGGQVFEPCYPSLPAWVDDYFAPMYARPLNSVVRWCAQWWDHAEAISRLEALWRSWEAARLDVLRGMAVWYRDFLDPQLPVLLGAAGPFARCAPDRHTPTEALPTVPAPPGHFDGPQPMPGSHAARSPTGWPAP